MSRLEVNEITNVDGTGSPLFPFGIASVERLPMQLRVSSPADALLTISASEVIDTQKMGRSAPPINGFVPIFTDTTINFQTGATAGTTVNGVMPSSTIGQFRRCGLAVAPDSSINMYFTPAAATLVLTANPGSLFTTENEAPLAWVDLVSTGGTSYKTVGSISNVIEANTSGLPRVHRFVGHSAGPMKIGQMFTINGYTRISSPLQTPIAAGSYSFDCATQHIFLKTGGTGTFTLANLAEGQTVTIMVTSTGSVYTITWAPTIRWASAAIPSPTSIASRHDLYNFIKVGGLIFGSAALNMG